MNWRVGHHRRYESKRCALADFYLEWNVLHVSGCGYDQLNRLTFNASNNRITSAGFAYDAAGNLTDDGPHTYTFDAESKISKVDAVSAYVYDGEGQRVRKLVGENLRFIYDMGGRQIAEFDGSTGALKKEYVYGASGLAATIEPTAINSNGTRYTTSDHLGSPRVVTNSSAGVVSRHDYMPFGEELFNGGRTVGMGYGVADGVRQEFTQKERDIETGLDYFLARYYSSTQGRFTSPDSYGGRRVNPQTLNLYSYVTNNPLKYVDPTGHAQEKSDCDQACQESRKEAERLRKEAEAEGVDTLTTEGKGTKYIPTSNQMITDWWDVLAGRFSVDSYMRNYQELVKARWRQGGEQGRAASKWLNEGLESNDLQFALTMTGAGSLIGAEDEAYVTVGRWMSQLELDKMLETALVQEGGGGITNLASPAAPETWMRQAKVGQLYVEFDVPKSVLNNKGAGWAFINGPTSPAGRNAARFGRLVPQMPPARNIVHKATKISN